MIKRLGAQQDRLFGDQKEFVYFWPGATRIAEKSSAPVKNRAHTIETQIDLQGDEEGVIVAVGGMTGGYSMFIKDNKLHYDYNFLDGVHYILKSQTLPRGKTQMKFNFIKTKQFGGKGELFVNGKKVDEIEMPQMHVATYSLAETFDVVRYTGTQVSTLYTDPVVFNKPMDRVIFTISDDNTVPPRKLPANYY
jgi:arylsulfatase